MMNSIPRRQSVPLRALLFVACMLIGAVSSGAVAAVPTLPILWQAGGLSAGSDSAGQAARIATDPFGNVAVVSGPSNAVNLAVTSYTSTGAFRWQGEVSPSIGSFLGDWVAAAPNGDFVAVGHNTNSSGQPISLTVVRYGADGVLQWRLDLARTLPAVGRLLVDSAGNAYLAFNSVGDGQDMQLHKYDPAGSLLWSQVINTGFLANDIATSLALSPDETDVVLTGNVLGGAQWTTASYDTSTGVRNWLVTAPEGTAARDVVVAADQVYVTGQGNIGITAYLSVVAYDRTTGARLWRVDKIPADGTGAAGLRMALAPDGSLVVTGQASRGFLDWYTVAFATDGTVLWEAVRDGGLNTNEIPQGLLVLADGTAVVTGRGGPNLPGGFIPGVSAGYSPTGVLLWEAFSPLETVWASALPNGDFCATGGYDAYLACFRPADAGGVNQPPLALVSATPTSGTVPLSVVFSSAGSADPDGSIVSYLWDFGDGVGSSTEANPIYVYNTTGIFTANLTVTDNGGATGTSTVSITVNPPTTPTLRSSSIALSAALKNGAYKVNGAVTVTDGAGVKQSGATVFATWTLPGGATQNQSVLTNSKGQARFSTSGGSGTYTLTVTNITKSGYTFDAANSILSKSITK